MSNGRKVIRMTKVVGADGFRDAVKSLLDEYGNDAYKVLAETVESAAKECVKQIKGNSKKRTGKYAKGWTKKQQYSRVLGTSYVVYNRDRYRVAHLLEHSHVIANKKGRYGSTVGDNVISDATDYTEEWLVMETEKRLGG